MGIGIGLAQLAPVWENDKTGTNNIRLIYKPIRFIGVRY